MLQGDVRLSRWAAELRPRAGLTDQTSQPRIGRLVSSVIESVQRNAAGEYSRNSRPPLSLRNLKENSLGKVDVNVFSITVLLVGISTYSGWQGSLQISEELFDFE